MLLLLATATAAPAGEVLSSEVLSSPATSFSFINSFFAAGFIVQCVILLLLLSSIWSWAIIFEKFTTIRAMKSRMSKFETDFWSGTPLDKLFRQVKNKQDNPMAKVFTTAIDEWNTGNAKQTAGLEKHRLIERVQQSMYVTTSKSMEGIDRNLGFLATVGSSATFIGLFGTVWGIMTSFQSIAASKNTSLAVVAPGIAEALFATALGLAVAIPATVFYNKFCADINGIANKVDIFSAELCAMIARELDN